MKCHGCSTLMVLDKQETGSGSYAQWHSCPLCGKVRLTSQPENNPDGTAQAGSQQFSPARQAQPTANLRTNQSTSSQDNFASSKTTTRKGIPYFA